MDFTVTATAERAPRPTELALVLDTTNSMLSGGRWERASETFDALITQMSTQVEDQRDFVVSFWPFADRVRLPDRYRSWGDGAPPADWNGCFRPREEPEPGFPYALTDRTPTQRSFEFSAPSTEPLDLLGRGPIVCRNEVVPPTTDVSDIRDGFDDVRPDGTGRFDQGLAWAWRSMSPQWRGRWGMDDYPRPKNDVVKMVIFLSDGYTAISNPSYMETVVELGTYDPHNQPSPEHMAHFVEVCRKMAADAIQLVMVSPPGSHPDMKAAMRSCATTPAHYHELETDDDLVGAMEMVLSMLTGSVRLIR